MALQSAVAAFFILCIIGLMFGHVFDLIFSSVFGGFETWSPNRKSEYLRKKKKWE